MKKGSVMGTSKNSIYLAHVIASGIYLARHCERSEAIQN